MPITQLEQLTRYTSKHSTPQHYLWMYLVFDDNAHNIHRNMIRQETAQSNTCNQNTKLIDENNTITKAVLLQVKRAMLQSVCFGSKFTDSHHKRRSQRHVRPRSLRVTLGQPAGQAREGSRNQPIKRPGSNWSEDSFRNQNFKIQELNWQQAGLRLWTKLMQQTE